VTSVFALLLPLTLALCAAVAFSPERLRRRLRLLLRGVLLLCFVVFAVSLWQIALRTSVALVAPGAARRPLILESALSQALTLLVSLGGPLALVSALAFWTLRVTLPGTPRATSKRRRRRAPRLTAVRAAGRDLDEVRTLFQEYGAAFQVTPCFQGFGEEVAQLPGDYAPPRGRLLLARLRGQVVGCVALRGLESGVAEVKRLFVRPSARGAGVGRALTEAALAAARQLGYTRVRLETVPQQMREAIALYRELGFLEIPPYRKEPLPGALYLEKQLG
jgi:GNAT superfamily N-acetyltransferase